MGQRNGHAASGGSKGSTTKRASWSKGQPPTERSPAIEDWETAPRLCSLAWAAWLVGMPTSTFRQLMIRDPLLRDRLSYATPGSGHRWYFTARVWEWVDGRQWKGLRIIPEPSVDP